MVKLMPRLFRKKQVFARMAARHACRIDGELLLLDTGVSYPGQLQNLSLGGAMFRPRLAYLLNRRDVRARLRLGEMTIDGTIVSTTPAGFGLSFADMLDDRTLNSILAAQQA